MNVMHDTVLRVTFSWSGTMYCTVVPIAFNLFDSDKKDTNAKYQELH